MPVAQASVLSNSVKQKHSEAMMIASSTDFPQEAQLRKLVRVSQPVRSAHHSLCNC